MPKKKRSSKNTPSHTKPDLPKAEPVKIDDLFLDPRNPRLAERNFSLDDQAEILRTLWKANEVDELVQSIATSGYWKHEVLFAALESDKLVVIEGNRRLAAVMLLVNHKGYRSDLRISDIPDISREDREKLKELPVIKCSRSQVWEYIGFKHVNGPEAWESIAKAEYIARVRNETGVALNEIARAIGDKHQTAARLYNGLMVLQQAEKAGVFDRDDRWATRFAYSHLWTGLGYKGFREFLGLKDQGELTPDPIPPKKLTDLGDLCRWLYGSKKENLRPVIRSQNPDLRTLDGVLRSKKGVATLRAGLPLETSLKASLGDERLLREAFVVAEQKLREAVALVITGYHGEEDLLKTAKDILLLADKIHEQMDEKKGLDGGSRTPTKRRQTR